MALPLSAAPADRRGSAQSTVRSHLRWSGSGCLAAALAPRSGLGSFTQTFGVQLNARTQLRQLLQAAAQKGISSFPSGRSGTRGEVFQLGVWTGCTGWTGWTGWAGMAAGAGAPCLACGAGVLPAAETDGAGGAPTAPRECSRDKVNSARFSFTPSLRVTVFMRNRPSRTRRWPACTRFCRSWARFPQPTTRSWPGGSSGRSPSTCTSISATGVWLSWV